MSNMWKGLQKFQKMAVEIAAPPRQRGQREDEDDDGEYEFDSERTNGAPQRLRDVYQGGGDDDEDFTQQEQFQRELSIYKKTIHQLESELQALKQQRNGPTAVGGGDSELQQLRNQISDLEKERGILQQQMGQYSEQVRLSHEQTVAYYQQLIATKDKEHSEALQLATATSASTSVPSTASDEALVKRVAELEAAAEQQQQQWETERSHTQSLHNATVSQLQESTQRLQRENGTLLDEARNKVDPQEIERKVRQDAEAASQRALTAQRNVSDRRIRELEETIRTLKTTGVSAAESLESSDSLGQQLDLANSEIASLKLSLERERAAAVLRRQELDKLHTELQTAQSSQRSLEGELSNLSRSADAARISSEQNCANLQAEVVRLRDQLKQSRDHVSAQKHQEVQLLEEKYMSAYGAKQQLESEVLRLSEQLKINAAALRKAEHDNATLTEQSNTQQLAADRLRTQWSESEASLASAREEANTLRQQVIAMKSSHESEKSTRANEEHNIATLTSLKNDLYNECERLRLVQQQLHQVATDALVNGRAQIPANSTASFSDTVSLLASEFLRYHNGLVEAHKVQQQWEATYQQARDVNGATGAQLKEAQRTVSELRADNDKKDSLIQSLQQRVKDETKRWQEVQVSAASQHNDTHRLQSEIHKLEDQCRVLRQQGNEKDEMLGQAQLESDRLRLQLQEREEELQTAQSATENLQLVLEQFQRNRQRDAEHQSSYLQHEIEHLKAELAAAEGAKQRHRDELEALSRQCRRDVAAKNVTITTLQTKLLEMKKVLEETVSQFSDEHTIDKRIVSQLVVNFVHSVATQREDREDILKVMSGLLNWDETMQQKAGILPGPLNPRRAPSLVSGIVRSVWGRRVVDPQAAMQSHAEAAISGQQPAKGSLAEMWVDFLMKESQKQSAKGAPELLDSSDIQS